MIFRLKNASTGRLEEKCFSYCVQVTKSVEHNQLDCQFDVYRRRMNAFKLYPAYS